MKLMLREKSTGWILGFVYFLLVSCIAAIHVRLHQYAFDDAFIHFRVARNFLETGLPYYNTNEILKVSTSTGWVVFLSMLFGVSKLFKFDGNIPLLVSITNAFITLCGVFVYTRIVEVLSKRKLLIGEKLLFQISFVAVILPSSIGLMETPLALLVAGLGIYFLLFSNPLGFALLALAIYFRLELLVLLILVGMFIVGRKKTQLFQAIRYGLLGAIPFFLFDLYFFHTIIPHSIIAKSKVYSLTSVHAFFSILFYSLPQILSNRNTPVLLGVASLTILCAFIATGWAVYRERKIINNPWVLVFFLWSLTTVGMYIVAHALVFDWYIPIYMIPLLVACFASFFLTEYPRNLKMKLPLGIMFLLSAISIGRLIYASCYSPSKYVHFEGGARVKTYLTVGRILNEEYPNETLLTSEIGGIGYGFEGDILDAAGLASSAALSFHPMKIPEQRDNGSIGAIPPEYVKLTMPDIIVSFDKFAQALLDDDVVDQYKEILVEAYLCDDKVYAEHETLWGNKYLRVFVHKTLPISERIYALGCDQ